MLSQLKQELRDLIVTSRNTIGGTCNPDFDSADPVDPTKYPDSIERAMGTLSACTRILKKIEVQESGSVLPCFLANRMEEELSTLKRVMAQASTSPGLTNFARGVELVWLRVDAHLKSKKLSSKRTIHQRTQS